MTLEQASAAVAFVSALAGLAVLLLGILERSRAFAAQQSEFDRQAEHWRAEFEAERSRQEVMIRKEFLLEQYRFRIAAYGGVLRTLGAVSDVTIASGGGPSKYKELHANRELFLSTASALYEHLYGEAGLLMTMDTRNVLHDARRKCVAFLNSDGDRKHGDELVDAFFYARRYLRADLELVDDRTPENLQKLVDKLGEEATAT